MLFCFFLVCPNIGKGVSRGFGHFCEPHEDCQGVTCGVPIKFIFIKSVVKVEVRLSTCTSELHIQLGKHNYTYGLSGNKIFLVHNYII